MEKIYGMHKLVGLQLFWRRTPNFSSGTPTFCQMGVLNSCFQNPSESSDGLTYSDTVTYSSTGCQLFIWEYPASVWFVQETACFRPFCFRFFPLLQLIYYTCHPKVEIYYVINLLMIHGHRGRNQQLGTNNYMQGLFQQFWEKAPGQNWEKMIGLT